jgi:MFS family permease
MRLRRTDIIVAQQVKRKSGSHLSTLDGRIRRCRHDTNQEYWSNWYRRRTKTAVHSGWDVGWGAAAILYTALFSLLPEAIAWRILFGIGVLPALTVFLFAGTSMSPRCFLQPRNNTKAMLPVRTFWKSSFLLTCERRFRRRLRRARIFSARP